MLITLLIAFIIIQLFLNCYFLYKLDKLKFEYDLLELDVRHNKRLFHLHQKEIIGIKKRELGIKT